MLRRTSSRLVVVRAAVMSSMASRKRVLRRIRGTKMLDGSTCGELAAGSEEEFKGISERTYIPCRARCGNVPGWRDPFPIFAAASECDCRRCAWKDNFGIPTLHSTVHRG